MIESSAARDRVASDHTMMRYFSVAPVLLAALLAAPLFATMSLAPSAAAACGTEPSPGEQADARSDNADAPRFIWPVHGMPVADLCSDGSERRTGMIEIAVREGTPVKAAADGIVAYAGGEMKSYGNLVLIVHHNDWVTAYGFASRLLVKRGDKVRQGETVALSGASPVTGSPLLHFEIRKTGRAVDAFRLLSERRGD
jgi:murein DD-endopeptidase MepM/ murein hydrolase activator NlpD